MTPQAAPPTFADFPAAFKGPLVRPEDEGYVEARGLWNMRRGEEQPALIAQALDADDIVLAVEYAGRQGIPVAVRSGGHGMDGAAMPHDALVIDTCRMKDISVDAATGRVTIGAGVLLGEMDAATQEHGYAVPAGTVTRTGAAGLTLGGGIGHLTRRFGATVDNLLAADVVTMDGRPLRASADENEELFWGLRGAGHNLAIATSFTFQAHKVGPQVMSGVQVYSAQDALAVFAGVDEVMARAPRELTTTLVVLAAPPLPTLPPQMIGRPVVFSMIVYTGPMDGFDEAMSPLRALATPLVDMVKPSTWLQANALVDPFQPTGRRYYSGGGYLPRLTTEVGQGALDRVGVAPVPEGERPGCIVTFPLLGGALLDVDEDATAFSRVGAAWLFEVIGQWGSPADDEELVAWVDGTRAALASPESSNGYVNLTADRGAPWLRGLYGEPAKWERLVALKREWDPDNRLCHNKNLLRALEADPA